MSYDNKKYLITGSTGFVGSRLLELLSASECDIRLLARRVNTNYETFICNFGQDKIPQSALESVDTIFHLAGYAHDVKAHPKVERLYNLINVDATNELAEIAARSGVINFVFVSSVKAGGSSNNLKCANENDQINPSEIYGKSKRESELNLLKIGRKYGMNVSIIRSSLVYGPGVKGNLHSMLSAIKKGWFPPLPETGNMRSMIHVDDLVQAILLVSMNKHANGEIFIATDGVPHSSREIYEAMCVIVGKPIPKWSVPKFLFTIFALISPKIRHKVDKLLGDECYSSNKLELLGFKAKRKLEDMNETFF